MKKIIISTILIILSGLFSNEKANGQAVTNKSQNKVVFAGAVLFSDGTKKQFQEFVGLETKRMGLYSGSEVYTPIPGKLIFEASSPGRMITVDLSKVSTITIGKIKERYKPVDITITWKDGKSETFIGDRTSFDIIWLNSQLSERFNILFGAEEYFAGAIISFTQ